MHVFETFCAAATGTRTAHKPARAHACAQQTSHARHFAVDLFNARDNVRYPRKKRLAAQEKQHDRAFTKDCQHYHRAQPLRRCRAVLTSEGFIIPSIPGNAEY